MRRTLAVVVVVLSTGLVAAGAPAQAATKKIQTTLAIPGHDVANASVGGQAEGVSVPSALKRVCPNPGEFEGLWYRFVDLKTPTAKLVKLYGPAPVVTQAVPATPATNGYVQSEYDIDVYGFDAKCKRVEGTTDAFSGTSTMAKEQFKPKKPVRYLVAVYWVGPYPNLPVTLEVTS